MKISQNRIVDGNIKIADGRSLGIREYGNPEGYPVFLFHGLPGTRCIWGFLPGDPIPEGVRAIALDRPGYGRSDANPNRKLLDWACDVEEVANHLKIGEFGTLGTSGGGPGALACAARMPERVKFVVLISSPAPTDAPGIFKGISRTNGFFTKLAWYAPKLSALNLRLLASVIRKNPEKYVNAMKHKVHKADQVIVEKPVIKELLINDFTEALRSGPQGMIDDMNANHGSHWGFKLNEIQAKVYIWSCLLDKSAPPAMGSYLHKMIPNSEMHVVQNAGHLWVLEHLSEVFEKVESDFKYD